MVKIKINKEKCIGCGLCVSICEKSFEMQGEKAIPIKNEIAKVTCEKEAVESCPTEAISIH